MEITVGFRSLTTTTHPPIVNLPSSGQQVTARLSARKVSVSGGTGPKIPWSGTLQCRGDRDPIHGTYIHVYIYINIYTGIMISPWPDQERNKLMFLSEWREFLSAPCLAGKNLMKARVSMLLKSRASQICFRACFLPGRAKDLSAPR